MLIAGARRAGADVARALAREGMSIALSYRSSAAAMQELQQELEAAGTRVVLVQADLGVEADVRRAVDTTVQQLGGLFAVVNLASDYERVPYRLLDAGAWERGMTAATASYLLALHAARAMEANPGPTRGHIMFCGDWAADETPYQEYLPYLTAKAAIHYMARAFGNELAGLGILANCVAPGPTAKPPDYPDDAWQAHVLGRTPLGRESAPVEIAEVVAMLLKLETVTGEVIRVDAGRHLAGPGWPN